MIVITGIRCASKAVPVTAYLFKAVALEESLRGTDVFLNRISFFLHFVACVISYIGFIGAIEFQLKCLFRSQ